jgi:protein TonB
VKQGNTLAKEQDQKQLEDDRTLPIPQADYLVSSMPVLMNEFRVPYPEEAKAQRKQGAVVMDLLIDEKGRVRKVSVLSGPGHGLNEAAEGAAYKLQFKPAEIEGKSVAVKIKYTYHFVLNQ